MGSHTFVKAQFFWTTRPSKKLTENISAPSRLLLELAPTLTLYDFQTACVPVHPVFYVSMLKPATPNPIPNQVQSPPPPVKIDSEPEYEISEILDSKVDKCHRHCNIWSIGQATKALTKKPHGFLLLNSEMLPRSSLTSTPLTLLNPDCGHLSGFSIMFPFPLFVLIM